MRVFRQHLGVGAVALALAIAGCSKPEAPAEIEQAEEAIGQEIEVDSKSAAFTGTFTAVDAERGEALWTLNPDNSFTLAADGVDPVSGTFTHTETDNGAVLCVTPDDADAGEICWDLTSPGEDGNWTAAAEDGSVLTVNRVGNGLD